MIRNILIASLYNRGVVISLAIAIMATGIWCLSLLKIEAYPDIADTNVIIVAQFPGRAAEEVEQQVTIPLERVLNNVAKVISRRSRTIFGLSVIQLTFEDGTDDYFARQQVNERLMGASLPEGVTTELAPLTTAVGEIFRYVVEAPPLYTPTDLREFQDWTIRPALLQVKGIADVTIFGGPVKQFHILTSPVALRKYNLTLNDIIEAVQNNNSNTGGNIIQRGTQGFALRGLGAVKTVTDIENIMVTSVNGIPVYIKQLCTVEIAPPPPVGILGYAVPDEGIDFGSSTEGIILLRRGENPSEALDLVKNKIKELEERELPAGVKIRTIYDRSTLVNYTLKTVSHTLLEGILIVILVLLFFLGSLRSAIVVAATIPFSLLFAFILMKLTGVPANLLSLGAIDFGIIVDGSCVMAEHLVLKLRNATAEEKKEGEIKVTLAGAMEVGREIFFSVTIIILAYLPILTMQRVEGRLFSPMALTLSFAVIGAMICALTLIPVLISLVYRRYLDPAVESKKHRRNIVLEFLEKKYQRLMKPVLFSPKLTVFTGLLLVLICGFIGTGLGTEFLPELDEGSIFMRAFLPSGVSIQENAKSAPIIRNVAKRHTQIQSIITQTGRNDEGTDPINPNRTEILIVLKDYDLWEHDTTKNELIYQLRRELEEALPGSHFSFGQPIIDQVSDMVTGTAADLAITITGNDLVLMRAKGDSIRTIVQEIFGAVETGMEQEGPQAQLSVHIDRKKAARYGINVSDIQLMIESAVGGKPIGTVYDGPKKYDILVRFYQEKRNTIDEIRAMQIPSASGVLIPLSQLADISLADGQTNIYHLDGKRQILVRTNVRGRDQGTFVKEARKKIRASIKFPKGYEVAYGGQFENLERAGKQLKIAIPLTLLIVSVFLFMFFKKVKYALIVLSCVFFGLSGGIIALVIRGYHFNVSAGVGFVSLFGVSVMAGVLLVSAINRKRGMGSNALKENITQASSEQLRPILMMLFVAIIGLIPAAVSQGIGSDVQRPLATVIIGGLLFILLLAPVVIPALYYLVEKKQGD
jgi:cobalt-zinc-cadmium resistance protein CzcA